MTDELPLGLPASTKRPRPEPKPVEGIRWMAYSAKDRRYCDDCVEETPTVGGVPVHVVNRAFWQRKQGTDVGYFCYSHHQDRLLEEGQ
jgi:hypothetical protein